MRRRQAPTTVEGYINKQGLEVLGDTGRIGESYERVEYVYVLHGHVCRRNCGSSGSSIWIRQCPYHQNGEPGPALTREEQAWRP